ncbi:MAG: aminotransferase class III-fold pyridoxal phosphate-dependent enzyme [Deltaproteobacteria bacterium]|nr:aminotransferase class III-fold pyridoxal phosphate-dependent enzyme [Deltaproteobacteria bacterium]
MATSDRTVNTAAARPALPADRALSAAEIVQGCKSTTMYSWSAGDSVDPIPFVRGERVWLWDADGKRYLDWNSQAMSVHVGHQHPKIVKAIQKQAEQLLYVYGGAATEVRARLGDKLARLMPGNLNTTFFTLGGGEANENAVRAARAVTGRHKIVVRYRSYHGATALTINMTGDHRRWANEPGPPGIVRVMDPQPYHYSFGASEEEVTANNLKYLDEIIMYEGGHTIAAFVLETMTGTNGVLPPPAGYLAGVRKLCDQHGILLVCDEVMTGFGRTGRWFAFEHGGIQPDLITMAKGLTSSTLPLGAVGVNDRVAQHFKKNVFYGGHTYNSHPMCLAAALANIEVIEDEGLVDNARRLEPVMRDEMARLQKKHPSMKAGRAIGLFGMIDLQKNARGEPFHPYGQSGPVMAALSKAFREHGLVTFLKNSNFTCIPPLCITEEELREGFAIVDKGLDVVDRHYEA